MKEEKRKKRRTTVQNANIANDNKPRKYSHKLNTTSVTMNCTRARYDQKKYNKSCSGSATAADNL